MKFILGYMPGSVSLLHKGPKLYWSLRADHKGKSYEFERLERSPAGVQLPKLRIYDSDDYPDAMISALLANTQIVEMVA